jgi:hypothetical protein
MQDLENILKKIKKFIIRCRKEANDSLNDTVAAQWEKVDFVNLGDLLASLGIDVTLSDDWKQYHKKAKTILKKSDILENGLGNVEADIKLSSVNPAKIKIEAKELAEKCRNLEPLLAEMLEHQTKLHNSAARIQDNLSPHTFISLARERTNRQNMEAFETGYKYFLIVSGEKGEISNNITLEGYFQAASAIEKKLKEIELPELPMIVQNIIHYQIAICQEAATAIKIFLDFCGESFQVELNNINQFQQQLNELRKKNIPEIIETTEKHADTLSKLLRSFFFKSYLIKELIKVEMLLQNLKQFLHVFRGDFLKELNEQILSADSLLNPTVLAEQTSSAFFSGIKGIVRMIKLLYSSIAGNKTISETEFQEKLTAIITSCSIYYCNDKNAVEKMTDFLNDHLKEYQQPFPRDELLAEARQVIRTYGESIEKYIFHTMITPLPGTGDSNGKQPKARPISLGRLIGKIEARGAVLTKIQHDQENQA